MKLTDVLAGIDKIIEELRDRNHALMEKLDVTPDDPMFNEEDEGDDEGGDDVDRDGDTDEDSFSDDGNDMMSQTVGGEYSDGADDNSDNSENKDDEGEEQSNESTIHEGRMGSTFGGLAGTVGGMLIGNAVAPGIGPMVGSAIGGTIGSLVGDGITGKDESVIEEDGAIPTPVIPTTPTAAPAAAPAANPTPAPTATTTEPAAPAATPEPSTTTTTAPTEHPSSTTQPETAPKPPATTTEPTSSTTQSSSQANADGGGTDTKDGVTAPNDGDKVEPKKSGWGFNMNDAMSTGMKGALAGAAVGAIKGALSDDEDSSMVGDAVKGAALGGLGGGLIGGFSPSVAGDVNDLGKKFAPRLSDKIDNAAKGISDKFSKPNATAETPTVDKPNGDNATTGGEPTNANTVDTAKGDETALPQRYGNTDGERAYRILKDPNASAEDKAAAQSYFDKQKSSVAKTDDGDGVNNGTRSSSDNHSKTAAVKSDDGNAKANATRQSTASEHEQHTAKPDATNGGVSTSSSKNTGADTASQTVNNNGEKKVGPYKENLPKRPEWQKYADEELAKSRSAEQSNVKNANTTDANSSGEKRQTATNGNASHMTQEQRLAKIDSRYQRRIASLEAKLKDDNLRPARRNAIEKRIEMEKKANLFRRASAINGGDAKGQIRYGIAFHNGKPLNPDGTYMNDADAKKAWATIEANDKAFKQGKYAEGGNKK